MISTSTPSGAKATDLQLGLGSLLFSRDGTSH